MAKGFPEQGTDHLKDFPTTTSEIAPVVTLGQITADLEFAWDSDNPDEAARIAWTRQELLEQDN